MFQELNQFYQEEERLYIFGQDNLTAEQVMIYIHHCCFEDLQNEARSNGLEIIPEFEPPSYKICTHSYKTDVINFQIQSIKLKILCQTIVLYKAESFPETQAKFNTLEDAQNYEQMLKYVQCKRIKATYNALINFEMFPKNYLGVISKMEEQKNYIFFVLENNQQKDREVLQSEIDEFMSTMVSINFQTKYEVIELDKDFTQNPKFMKYIYDLQNEFNLIQIQVVNNEETAQLCLTGKSSHECYSELEEEFSKLKSKIQQIKNMDIENSFIWGLTQGGTNLLYNVNLLEFKIKGSDALRVAYLNKRFSDENIQFQMDGENIKFYFMGQRDKIKHLKQVVSNEIQNLKYVFKNIIYDQSRVVYSFLLDKLNFNYFENLIDQKYTREMISLKIDSVDENMDAVIINIEILYNELAIQLENNLISVIQLFNNLSSMQFEDDIEKFIEFYQFVNLQKFCLTKNLIIKKIDNKDVALGLSFQIDELRQLYTEYQQQNRKSQLQLKKSTKITIENRLIYIAIKNQANENILGLSKQCTLKFPKNTNQIIIYSYDISLISESVAIIKKYSDQQMKTICKAELLNQDQKILEYLRNDGQQKIKQIEEENVCQISLGRIQNKNSGKEEIIISYNESKLILKSGIQTELNCDLVVLQTKNFMCLRDQDLGLAKQKVIQMFGNDYVKHCITNVSKLGINEISVYQNQENKKNIINIVTPTYKFGDDLQVSKEIIERNIRKVFQVAKEMNSQSISLTIQGSGACSNTYKQLSEAFLISLIDRLFSYDTILTVYIFEQYEPRFQELKNITQKLVYPQRQRQIKFQWYFDQGGYEKYNLLINSQIDEDYEIYLADQTKNKFQIEYSYLEFEPTHQIDLINKTIMDLKTNTNQILEVNEQKGKKFYKIGPNLLDDRLINYLNLQELENELVFKICLTQHLIVFQQHEYYQETVGNKTKMFVINQPLNFERQEWKNHVLLGLDFEWNEQNYITESEMNLNSIEIQTFDMVTQQSVLESLNQLINENLITFKYQVPNLFDEEINNLKRVILASAISINNQIEGGQQIEIKIYQRELQLLQQNLIIFNEHQRVYPTLWVPQRNILEKVLLDSMSQEYQDIVRHFKETDNGQIYQIKRIQNKILWENYSNEINKLTKYHQRQGYNMSNQEQQRYVWHGVRGQHPKIIYEGMKEGFNCAYSANGMWGPGIYFAQNAKYSRDYSYRLKQEEGLQHQNRLIMLYCLLTTGKVENRNPDSNIKQPSNGFDCVSGVTNGSTVFILYAMDIRRAYPAYEIIYS